MSKKDGRVISPLRIVELREERKWTQTRLAKEMSEEYDITQQNAASILDTFSCIFQGVIPYGAQMLVAVSASAELGCELSACDIMPNLVYPYILLL